jgi:hypothetical protein
MLIHRRDEAVVWLFGQLREEKVEDDSLITTMSEYSKFERHSEEILLRF